MSFLFLGLLLFLGLSLAAPYIKPSRFDLISILGLGFPFIWMISVIVLLFTYFIDKRYFIFLLIPVLIGMIQLRAYVNLSLPHASPGSDGFTVLSYNAMMGVKMVDKKHRVTEDLMRQFESQFTSDPLPDILCLQEVNFIAEKLLKNAFDYPYYHKIEEKGSVILSRYPIVKSGKVEFGTRINSCLWADIKIRERTLRIYSVHLESNRLKQQSYQFLNQDEYESSEAINGVKDLLSKYPRYASSRAEQVELVKEHIAKSPFPVILCGDFNDPPGSFTYRKMKKNLHDSFLSAGSGIGTTWLGGLPLMRIDYILFSDPLKISSYKKLDSDMSDHAPISASFSF